MSLHRKIAHNTAAQFIGKAAGSFIALFATTLLFHYLGPSEYGKFHIILTFVQLTGILADMGLYLIVLNDIGDEGQNPKTVVSQHFTLRLYLNVAYMFLMAIIAFFVPYELAIKWGIFVMSLGNLFNWYSQIFQSLFQKNFTTYYGATAEIIGRTVLLGATVFLIYIRAPLLMLTLTVVAGNGVQFFCSWFFARKYVSFPCRLNRAYMKSIFIRGWPVALSIWFTLVYFKADTIILSLFKSKYDVGIYGMPYRILETLVALPILFMGLLMPLLRNAYSRGNIGLFKRYMQKGFDGLSVVALPMLFGTIVLAQPIIYLLGGKEFAASIPLLRILIVAVSIMFMTSLFAHAIITINGQRSMIKFYMSIAILMLALYLIFIPWYSYWAAAILTVLSELLGLIAVFFAVYKKTAFIPNMRVFSKSAVSAILMAGAIFFIRDWPLLAIIPLAGVLYGLILYYLGGIKKETVTEILKIKGN